MCCILDDRDRSQCCVKLCDYKVCGWDCYDTLSSVSVIFSSRVSMLAVPLFFYSIFPLNAVEDTLSVAGCELSISDAVSLCGEVSELLSLHDCFGSSGLPESLVVSRVDNPCFAGVSSLSCLHVGDPSDHSNPLYIGHECCDCVSGCNDSVCACSCDGINSSYIGFPQSHDRFELPSFCQLLCNHGPSRRLRRSSLAGLYSDSVGGVADASSIRHNGNGEASGPAESGSAGSKFQISERSEKFDVDLCVVNDLICVFGCCVCSTPACSWLAVETFSPEYHICVCFGFARSCCVSACSSACIGACVAFVPFECQEVRILGCCVSSCSTNYFGISCQKLMYVVDDFDECPCAVATYLGGVLCALAASMYAPTAYEIDECDGLAPPPVHVSCPPPCIQTEKNNAVSAPRGAKHPPLPPLCAFEYVDY